MAQAYSRDELLSMGLDYSSITRAEKHFGSSITTEKAVGWIFDNPDGEPEPSNNANTAVVPYAGDTSVGEAGWESGPKPAPDYSAWDPDDNDGRPVRETMTISQAERDQRGRTGRTNTPVDGQQGLLKAGTTANDPVDLTVPGGDGSMPPLEDPDADLEKALALSLQDANAKAGPLDNTNQAASAMMMSRQPSRSRQQQEDDEMAQALSMSMVDVQASGTLAGPEGEETIAARLRKSADHPMALLVPSSAFLSYLPNVLQSFYYNLPFRRALLSLEFSFLRQPTYEQYATEKPAIFTRSLFSGSTKDFIVKLAALQRLFVFMEKSKRAKTPIADVLDAFQVEVPKNPSKSPIVEIQAMQRQICQAWLEYHNDLLNQNLATIPARAALERATSILWCNGVQLEGAEQVKYLSQDPDETKDKEMIENLEKHPICLADLRSCAPESNDTYAALDQWLHGTNRAGFIYTPSQSLYVSISRMSKPAEAIIGPSLPQQDQNYYSDSMPSGKPFQIAPTVYLDRYDWHQRSETTRLREAASNANAELTKFAQRKNKLAVYRKTGAPIVAAIVGNETGASKQVEDTEAKKAVLEKTINYLTRASESEQDESRKNSQLRLVEKLKKITTLLVEEISRLNKQIQDLSQANVARWESTRKSIGPYELRSVLYWRGLPGRESTHIYVQSGTTRVEIDEQVEEHAKWWRITDAIVEEVSKDTVLSDTTGMYMPGGGSLLHAYVDKRKESEAWRDGKVPNSLLKAIEEDNQALDAEIVALQAKLSNQAGSQMPETSESAIDGIPIMEATTTTIPDAKTQLDTDVQMTAESQEPSITESAEPLRLAGGSSVPTQSQRQRRSSMSSDTGSVASTSKVRIGDEEEDMEEEEGNGQEGQVELGFAEKLGKKGFKVVKDVGKIGGKPTWLNPALPLRTEMITCAICQQRMEFLMQINAPLDELPEAIYRTFYVYTCRKVTCVRQNRGGVKIFRTQLPAGNPFYEVKAAEDQSELQPFKDRQYSSFCPTCKLPNHEQPCPSVPWKEWLIETGPEDLDNDDDVPTKPEDIEATMKSATLSDEDGSADAKESDTKAPVDAAFLKFQERLRDEPDQILRYYYRDTDKQAEPLWVSDESKPESIAACTCGSPRSCEFQILSTILSYIGVDDMQKDSLDFGTIAVFTCQASCSSVPAPDFRPSEDRYAKYAPQTGWQEEVAYVQEYSLKGVQFR